MVSVGELELGPFWGLVSAGISREDPLLDASRLSWVWLDGCFLSRLVFFFPCASCVLALVQLPLSYLSHWLAWGVWPWDFLFLREVMALPSVPPDSFWPPWDLSGGLWLVHSTWGTRGGLSSDGRDAAGSGCGSLRMRPRGGPGPSGPQHAAIREGTCGCCAEFGTLCGCRAQDRLAFGRRSDEAPVPGPSCAAACEPSGVPVGSCFRGWSGSG